MELIQPFLDNNDELYGFILNWITFIIQNPSVKTESAIVLTGKYGSSKNSFSNTKCEFIERIFN